VKGGYRNVVIRTRERGNFKAMCRELEGTFSKVKVKKG
jgi:hypothetical protein